MTRLQRPSRAHAIAALSACAGVGLFGGPRTIVLAQSPIVVRVGSGSVEDNAQSFYAVDAGFFRRNGIDGQLTILRGGAVEIGALVAGQLDTGEASTVSFGSGVLRGVPLVAIAPGLLWDARYPSAAIAVAPNSPIKSGKDLNDKTVAVTALAALGVLGVQAYMDATGGDRSTVKFLEIPSSALADAVAAGRVDAAVIDDPALSGAVASGKVRWLVDALNGIGTVFCKNVWFTKTDWLAQNRETAKRFADAIISAGIWAEGHREQSLTILAKYTNLHMTKSEAQFGRRLDPALLQPAWNAAYKYKLYPTLLKAADYCWDGK